MRYLIVFLCCIFLISCGQEEPNPYSQIKKPGFTLTDAGGFTSGTKIYLQGTYVHTRIHCDRISFTVHKEDLEPQIGEHYTIASWFLPGTPLPWKMKLVLPGCTDYDVCGEEIWNVEPLPYWEGGE